MRNYNSIRPSHYILALYLLRLFNAGNCVCIWHSVMDARFLPLQFSFVISEHRESTTRSVADRLVTLLAQARSQGRVGGGGGGGGGGGCKRVQLHSPVGYKVYSASYEYYLYVVIVVESEHIVSENCQLFACLNSIVYVCMEDQHWYRN